MFWLRLSRLTTSGCSESWKAWAIYGRSGSLPSKAMPTSVPVRPPGYGEVLGGGQARDEPCHVGPFVAPLSSEGLQDGRAARLVVPLVVKFCGQWLARSAP